MMGVSDMVNSAVKSVLDGASNWADKSLEIAPAPFNAAEKREADKARWMLNFWEPIYRAACIFPHPEYNEQMLALEGKAKEIVDTRGVDYAPAWYMERLKRGSGLALDEAEFLARQEQLGCAVKDTGKKLSLGTLALGGAAIAAVTVAMTILLTRGR